MKKLIIVCLVLLGTFFIFGEKLKVLEEVVKPDSLSIAHDCLYIQEGITFHIYKLKDLTYVKKFGKEGEGPREFKNFAFANLMSLLPFKKDQVMINSLGKLSIFSKLGKFVQEFKKQSPFENHTPFLDGYLVMGSHSKGRGKMVLALYLAGKDMQRSKTPFHITDLEQGQNAGFKFPFVSPDFGFYKEKIFVTAMTGKFTINIYDKTGKKISQITNNEKPIKLTSEYREKTLKWFKTNPTWKNIYPFIKDRFVFKSHFPVIYRMNVEGDRIYVVTNKIKNGMKEGIVLDINGKELHRKFLPLPLMYGMEFTPKYAVHDGYMYILIDNEDEEVIELHRFKM